MEPNLSQLQNRISIRQFWKNFIVLFFYELQQVSASLSRRAFTKVNESNNFTSMATKLWIRTGNASTLEVASIAELSRKRSVILRIRNGDWNTSEPRIPAFILVQLCDVLVDILNNTIQYNSILKSVDFIICGTGMRVHISVQFSLV